MDQHKSSDDHQTDSGGEHTRSAANMQEANATGAGKNEQGQASFITGSTTGGGSNHGQGSSHLGGGSYRQGDTTNTGSNYNNEISGLGDSTIGTSDEGASSSPVNDDHSDTRLDAGRSPGATDGVGEPNQVRADGGPGEDDQDAPREGGRRDTGLEADSGMSQDKPATSGGRHQSGSWSLSSADGD